MSLTAVTNTLEADWTRRLRRDQPQRRWAATHPGLGGDAAALRRQLADWRSADGRARVAELVDLARRGDNDAAILVTLTVLPSLARYEQRCAQRGGVSNNTRRHDYDTLAGAVWEALITSRSYKPAHLREDIIRRAWLITQRRTLSPPNETPTPLLHVDDYTHVRLGRARPVPPFAARVDHAVEDIAAGNATITAALDRLTATGQLNDAGRRVLESIAAGGTGRPNNTPDPTRAFAQSRHRLLKSLRGDDNLIDALGA